MAAPFVGNNGVPARKSWRRSPGAAPASICVISPLFAVAALLACAISAMASRHIFSGSPPVCGPLDGPVEQSTPLINFLQRVQSSALQTLGPKGFDPKLYVDLPLRRELGTAEAAFDALPRSPGNGTIPAAELNRFLGDYFSAPEADLVYAEPADFVPEPEDFLPKVKSPAVRAWALEVHSLWKNLSRRVADEVKAHPERHTLLPLPDPVIIPGSRFREVYYWDSYWIIRYAD